MKASIPEGFPQYESPLESLPSPHRLTKNIFCSFSIQVFSWSFAMAKEVVQSSWPPKRLKLQKDRCRYHKLTFPCFIKFLRNELFNYGLLGSEKKDITCNKEKKLFNVSNDGEWLCLHPSVKTTHEYQPVHYHINSMLKFSTMVESIMFQNKWTHS